MTEKNPVVPPPPWIRVPSRGKSRRRDPRTRDDVVQAALRLLDADGLEAFSMRRVAEEMGTGAASLYWYVGSKDGLLDLMLDEVIGEFEIPDPEPEHWQDQIREVARSMRRTILRHRDIGRLSVGRTPMGPHAVRITERVLAILRSGGVPDALAVQSYLLLLAVVNGFTMDESGSAMTSDDVPEPEDMPAAVRDYFASLPPTDFPHLTQVANHFSFTDQDARFELLIGLFVDGISASLAAGAGEAR